jgi:hypothetical protein
MCVDDAFGPLVASCARHADFTLLFEQSVLAIPCDAFLLALTSWRIGRLWKAHQTTRPGRSGLAKQIIAIAWALLQVLYLVWTCDRGAAATRASVLSATLGLTAAIIYIPLSYLEHSGTVQPSTLVNVYVAASLLLGFPQARILFSITSKQRLKATFTAVLVVKALLLFLKAWEKRALLYDQYQALPAESTSGILNKVFFDQHRLYRHITMLRGSLIALIYTESLTMEDGLEDASSAVTLISTDVDRICQGMVFMHDVWARPLELCVGISLVAVQLGWVAVVPVLVVMASAIADTRVAVLISGRIKAWTDQVQQRISLTGDVLLSLKSVKMLELGLVEPIRVLLQRQRLQELNLRQKFRWSTVWLNALGT